MTTATVQDSASRLGGFAGLVGPDYRCHEGGQTLLGADLIDVLARLANAEERLRQAVSVLLRDGYFTPDEVGFDVAPRIGELASHLRGVIARARQAVSIAGDADVTDWQRGYRACSDRAMAVLGQGERADAAPAVPVSFEVVPTVPRVADWPCPKCGDPDVHVAYCDGCDLRPTSSALGAYEDDRCSHGDPEHLHRNCRRCSYRWRTDDVRNARTVCTR